MKDASGDLGSKRARRLGHDSIPSDSARETLYSEVCVNRISNRGEEFLQQAAAFQRTQFGLVREML